MKWTWLPIPTALALLTACVAKEVKLPEPHRVDCCFEYGIDVNLVLGPQAFDCGTSRVVDAVSRRRNREVVACARAALAAGRAFVVSTNNSVTGEIIQYIFEKHIAVFGPQGEKMVIHSFRDNDSHTYSIMECPDLKILDTGYFEAVDCRENDALVERMTVPDSDASKRQLDTKPR